MLDKTANAQDRGCMIKEQIHEVTALKEEQVPLMYDRHKIKTKIMQFFHYPDLFFSGLFTLNLRLCPLPYEPVLQGQFLEASRPLNIMGKVGTNVGRQAKEVTGFGDFLRLYVKFMYRGNDPHLSII